MTFNFPGFRAWLGQATTGHGAAILLGTGAAAGAGFLSVEKAVPLLIYGGVLAIWPERTAFAQDAMDVATSIETGTPIPSPPPSPR